jgi:hypothetical protein
VHRGRDLLERVDVPAVVAPVVLVHRDVRGVPAVRRGQPDVVRGRDPNLDRERDVLTRAVDCSEDNNVRLRDVARRLIDTRRLPSPGSDARQRRDP